MCFLSAWGKLIIVNHIHMKKGLIRQMHNFTIFYLY